MVVSGTGGKERKETRCPGGSAAPDTMADVRETFPGNTGFILSLWFVEERSHVSPIAL